MKKLLFQQVSIENKKILLCMHDALKHDELVAFVSWQVDNAATTVEGLTSIIELLMFVLMLNVKQGSYNYKFLRAWR